MNKITAMAIPMAASALVLVLVGCTSAAPAGTGPAVEYRWISGQLISRLAASVPVAEQAVRDAFTELDLVGVAGAVDGLKGEVTARMAIGTRVRVKLEAIDFERTIIRIRVGRIGDRAIAQQVLRHIERQLE